MEINEVASEETPLEIIGMSFLGAPSGVKGEVRLRLWPTNKGLMTLRDLSVAMGVNRTTLYDRIAAHGHDYIDLLAPRQETKIGFRIKGTPRRDPESIKIGSWELQQLRKEAAYE